MTIERKAELCEEILGFASEMWRGYELYEWARNRGMTHKEIKEEFHFDDDELQMYYEQYSGEHD